MQTKFICASNAFAKALALLTPVVPTRPLVPALENVLLIGTGSVVGQAASVRLIASNIETTLSTTLAIECQENWVALVPAKRLLDTLRALPDQPVTFTVDDTTFQFEMKAERSRYKLTGENPNDFPKVPGLKRDHKQLTIPGNVLRKGLQSALTTARKDNLGAEFENVLIEVKDYNICIVGADNPNVSVFEYTPDANPDTMEQLADCSFMLSRSPAQYLASILSDKDETPVTLLIDPINTRLADGRWASRVAEGTYPAYRRVIPRQSANTLWVDADELLAAVKRLDKYANGLDRSITLHLDNALGQEVRLTVENGDFAQDGSEVLGGDYQGEAMSICFNASQLADLLNLYEGRIEIGMDGPGRAIAITQEADAHDYSPLTCILVPLQTAIPA